MEIKFEVGVSCESISCETTGMSVEAPLVKAVGTAVTVYVTARVTA